MTADPDGVQPPAPSHQRPDARALVRADRARLHADRRGDGADQPRAWVAVRARRLCGARARRAEAAAALRDRRVVARAAARPALRADACPRTGGPRAPRPRGPALCLAP